MVEDVEAVRRAHRPGKSRAARPLLWRCPRAGIRLQVPSRALEPASLLDLLLDEGDEQRCSIGSKEKMPKELRDRIEKSEKGRALRTRQGLREESVHRRLHDRGVGRGYFPYLYQRRPDPNYDPVAAGSWRGTCTGSMGSHGEYVIDGNLVSAEYTDPPFDDPRSDPRHGGRSRRVRPGAVSRVMQTKDRGVEAGHLSAERTHDLRGPARDVHQDRRGVPRGEASNQLGPCSCRRGGLCLPPVVPYRRRE